MGGLVDGNYPAELPHGRKPRPLRPRSIRNIVGVVMGGVLAYAVEHDWITENPLAKVTLPKIVRSDDGHGGSMLGLPKNGRARSVAVPRFLVAELKPLLDGAADDDWLFRAARGGNIWLHNWRSRIWNRAVRAAGLEDEGATIHSLRHTYASFAIAQGADVKTLQAQLGHASATITLDTYAALWPERLDDVADAIEAPRGRVLEG